MTDDASSERDAPCEEDTPLVVTAYEVYPQSDMHLVPSPINREWMDQTSRRFAYRCLPMTIANQAGWIITNPSSFTMRWNGGPLTADTTLVFDETPPDSRITSLFGHGTVTFNIPYLFRTPPGINLWVKGVANRPKHGVQALEGLVETDWTSATFTVNWKITRPNELVRFERGEPICMLVPYPRKLIESLTPQIRPIDDNAEIADAYRQWSSDRNEFHRQVADGRDDALSRGWQKDYFQGRDPGSERFENHQTRLQVKPFQRANDANSPDRPQQ